MRYQCGARIWANGWSLQWIKFPWYCASDLAGALAYFFLNQRAVGARLRDLHVCAVLVHPEPAAFNGQLDPGAVLRRRAALLVQERLVDLLDVNAAVLDGLNRLGDLKDFEGGDRRKAGRR